MKKLLALIAIVFALSANAFEIPDVPNIRLVLHMSVGIIKQGTGHNPFPRTPVNPPSVEQDGHTLYLPEGHPACTLLLMDADEEVVYEVDVPEGVDVVELPATLTGIYELQLYYEDSNFYFYSEIEL